MVKKSASDVSIASGTQGQYSILQTAKLLPGAPQQPVRPLLGSGGVGSIPDLQDLVEYHLYKEYITLSP